MPGPLAWLAGILVVAAVLTAPRRARVDTDHPETSREAGPGGWARGRRWSPGRDRRRGAGRGADDVTSTEQVCDALALLALAYRSGLPTWQVLTAVADVSPAPVARDLRQVAAALQWGAADADAWASVGDGWAPAARAVGVASRAGIAPGELLVKAADDVRRSGLEQLEVAAARVGVRLVAPLGLVLLPAFCLTAVVPLVVSLGRALVAG